ncbi:hypothetical protein [Roseivirga pacifica]|uniref:hypothetical protein n=1 Tax=Roseivirga pacifica TaxID=1267423 RepID=UPI00209529E8|nr:hypothetical protein [Roseivirga pacifica]MCO6358063.1 hypothetical protein [Roseivirga pacifica]MCO6366501.1 hypothetical protein [Roseivirga pacifica]MCO6370986.1 hypothetical protein [Roseivirga pacifica]MCO6373794.1 hypothetical protein [Roseivirga pacifica]MCO6380775.1 hypothetical protein [Roseivirga pacifica]
MSYHENRNLVNMAAAILVPAVYFYSRLNNVALSSMESAELLKFWGKQMMIYILVAIGIRIAIEILYAIVYSAITKESVPKTDERDKMIELKSKNVSQVIFIFGIIGGMGALALEMSVTMFFVSFLVGGVLAELVENTIQLVYYKRGF